MQEQGWYIYLSHFITDVSLGGILEVIIISYTLWFYGNLLQHTVQLTDWLQGHPEVIATILVGLYEYQMFLFTVPKTQSEFGKSAAPAAWHGIQKVQKLNKKVTVQQYLSHNWTQIIFCCTIESVCLKHFVTVVAAVILASSLLKIWSGISMGS